MYMYLCVYLSIYLSISLSVCLSIYLSVYLSIYLSRPPEVTVFELASGEARLRLRCHDKACYHECQC